MKFLLHVFFNYAFQYSLYKLYQFHLLVLSEIIVQILNGLILIIEDRGQYCPKYESLPAIPETDPIYQEHD